MFFAIVFIAIGLAILLNTLGFMNGTFWGFFWAIFFIAAGLRMMFGKCDCPMCRVWWHSKKHQHDGCCGHNHQEQN